MSRLLALEDAAAQEPFDLFPGNDLDRSHGNESGGLASLFNGYQHGLFSSSAPPPFSGFFAADKSVIQFNPLAEKPVNAVSVGHGGADFLQHASRRDPGDVDLFGKPHGGDAALVRGHQANRPKPFDKGQVGRMKQGACRNRSVMPTLHALTDFALRKVLRGA